MTDFFTELFQHISPAAGYFILFLSAFIENTFPPIPGDTVTVLGAYLITTGFLGFWGVYISTTSGSVAGFFTMYLIGARLGRSFTKTKFSRWIISEEQIDKVGIWFSNYGFGIIAANRFLSGTRSVISFFSGIFHLKWWKVLLYASLSAAVWNGLLIYAGYQVGVNWQLIVDIVSQYNKVVIGLTLLGAGYYFYRKYKKSRG